MWRGNLGWSRGPLMETSFWPSHFINRLQDASCVTQSSNGSVMGVTLWDWLLHQCGQSQVFVFGPTLSLGPAGRCYMVAALGRASPVSLPAPSPLGHWPQQDLQLTGRSPQMGFACCMISSTFKSLRRKTLSGSVLKMSHCEICFSLLDDITLVFCFNTDIKCLIMFGS